MLEMVRNTLSVLLLALLFAVLPAATPAAAKNGSPHPRPTETVREETRALWVNRWEYRSPADITRIMENAERAHFNVIFFQVRGPSDALYRSDLDPCSVLLCGRLGGTPSWDPLEVAVREAHARGLHLHAWINALSGWESDSPADCRLLVPSEPGRPNHLLIDHPDWAMYGRSGREQPCPNGQEYVYLSPGHPGVRTHLARVAADVVRRYGVDGIHLDRIRYPDAEFGWDPTSIAAFGRDPAADPAAWAAFRRELVNQTVRETHDSITAVRREVPLSAAVWPIYDRTRFGWPSSSGTGQFFQDTWAWAEGGYLDAAVPMTYFRVAERPCSYERRPGSREPNPDWTCMVADHLAGVHPSGRHVYAAVYSSWSRPEIAKQIRIGRERGVDGFAFYSYGPLARADAWQFLADGPFREPAVPSRMSWKGGPE